MGLTESTCVGLGFGDIHNIYTRHPVSTPQNVLKNQNHLSGMMSFLGISTTKTIDNQIVALLNTS